MNELLMFLFLLSVVSAGFVAGRWWSRSYELPGEPVHFHGMHLHECECGNSWWHDDRVAPVGYWQEHTIASHTCECGREVYEISHSECDEAPGLLE